MDLPEYSTDSTSAQNFVSAGLVPCAPEKPSLCVSIRTVELFRRLRLRSPRLSAQAFVNGLCDYQDRVSRRVLVQQFTTAFDFYLSMRTQLDAMVDQQLGRAGHQWRIQNSCPCCLYRTKSNAPLMYELLYAMDGNNSLKRVKRVKKKDVDGNVIPARSMEHIDTRMDTSVDAPTTTATDGAEAPTDTPGDPGGYFIPRARVDEYAMDKLEPAKVGAHQV